MDLQTARSQMVHQQIRAWHVLDERILAVFDALPRDKFVPEAFRNTAYADAPIPLPHGEVMMSPQVEGRALMALAPKGGDSVLEIGTGSGYQAAVLAELAGTVCSIEVIPELASDAAKALAGEGYTNVILRTGDGGLGWPERAPFDAIIVTAAAPEIPPALVEQLRAGGRMMIPVGPRHGDQELVLLTRNAAGDVMQRSVLPVAFVPLTGGSGAAG